MIRCTLDHLKARCRERGYTLDDARACIVSQDGDQITVDEAHAAYPRQRRAAGPGAELTKLLARIGITAKPGCSCKRHASQMDAWGPDGCEANLEKIVGWLRQEAQKRRLPWVDSAGRLLIKRAIANARRASACTSTGSS